MTPYTELIETPEGIELRDATGATAATISGATPEAQKLIEVAPKLLNALENAEILLQLIDEYGQQAIESQFGEEACDSVTEALRAVWPEPVPEGVEV